MMAENKKKLRCCGVAVKVLAFLTNAILWSLAFYSSGFAIVIGLSSNTIGVEDGATLDWIIPTPATIFLFSGLPLLILSTFGCFATISANMMTIVVYVVLIGLFILYDTVFGISLITGDQAYDKFITSLKESQYDYNDSNSGSSIGVIPINPTVYWDHLQTRGKCCGLYSYEDWKNTSIAHRLDKFSVPDSCCNELYEYPGCGKYLWKHPDHEQHTIQSIIYDRGCISVFPSFIQNDDDGRIKNYGRILLVLLIADVVLSIVLFALVISRAFKTSTGINSPDCIDVSVNPSILIERHHKVHPDCGGDRENNNVDERPKRISFDDTGPTLIPDEQHTPLKKYNTLR